MKRRTPPASSSPRALGLADLARSGLDEQDAKRLRLQFLSAAETERRLPGHRQASILIPYVTAEGQVRQDLFRTRFLEPPAAPFGAVPAKWQRYGQPKGSVVGAYFPPLYPWPTLADKPPPILLITEGEKKAAKACKEGFPCIGLGGVWSFMTKAGGSTLIPELEKLPWQHRQVAICYDSDVTTKPEVAAAIVRLVDVLRERGASVRVVTLPEVVPGEKCGLDDYLLARGKHELVRLLESAEADELARELWTFNERFAYVEHPSLVLDQHATDDTHRKVSKPLDGSRFKVSFGNRVAMRVVMQGEQRKAKSVRVADEWLVWPSRRTFESLTYLPGQPDVVNRKLNGWRGLSVEPVKGSVKPWKELLDHLFTGADSAARRWFERWCGYPLKHLGTKLLSTVGVWSAQTGQGKTLVGETLGRIYGPNYVSVPQQALEDRFNGWALNRQFVLVDDVSGHDTRQRADLFKKLITQDTLLVNTKFIPEFTVPDFINYYLTSNHAHAFYLDEHDRRFFVHEVTVGRLGPEFYDRYYAWLAGPGPAALLHYFQQELDYGDFNAKTAPPTTAAKETMVAGVRSELDAWLADLRDGVGTDLGDRDLFTVAELCERFNSGAAGRKVAPNVFSLRLRQVAYPLGVLKVAGAPQRWYAVRNLDRWKAADHQACAAHIQKTKKF